MKQITLVLMLLCLITIFSTSSASAAEVPFEVIKTKVVATKVVSTGGDKGIDAIVIDGIAYDPAAEGTTPKGKSFGHFKKGEYDKRVKVPITGIKYKLEFWNVGAMGGEKGFIFKSNYDKAKLTITYVTGQAYKMVGKGKVFMGLQAQEKKEVDTPNIKPLEFELNFSGGPYGTFALNKKDKKTYLVGRVVDGKFVKLSDFDVNNFLVYEDKAILPITSSAFDKWMEVLNQNSCGPDSPPLKDSGIRFNNYNGEVMIRPDCDEDAWYGAELDMVLNIDDHIKTGDDSTCSLALEDLTTFVMKPDSEIILSQPGKYESKISLVAGKIWANVKHMVKGETMDVEMSEAVAGIKGTTFIVEDTGTESKLKVIEGEVEFTSKATGKKEIVKSGEAITATKAGLEEKKKFDTEKEDTGWNEIKEELKNAKRKENPSKNKTTKKKPSAPLSKILILALAVIGGLAFWKKKIKK